MLFALATAQAAEMSTQDDAGFGARESMSAETLAQTRGRDGVNVHLEQVQVQSVQDMKAVSSGSSFQVINGDMATGNITFESGSMGHYSGTGIFNSVTGNANAINNAIGISVYIANP
ncbi:hypothetical protein [Halomonas getboli]|uniref:hypothetical protein n=1 Tax=Halomonas getboli TaxID=2935862 RepID=UPI001FFF1BD5|nr:hypothetical protein [Halomonas getboli]MCK2185024.1 hypothetical protein [Halomonas getboli]